MHVMRIKNANKICIISFLVIYDTIFFATLAGHQTIVVPPPSEEIACLCKQMKQSILTNSNFCSSVTLTFKFCSLFTYTAL